VSYARNLLGYILVPLMTVLSVILMVFSPEKETTNYSDYVPNAQVRSAQMSAVFGDSHASHYVPLLNASLSKVNVVVTDKSGAGCLPTLDVSVYLSVDGVYRPLKEHCVFYHEMLDRYLSVEQPNFVFLAARWEAYLSDEYFVGLDDKNVLGVKGQEKIFVVVDGIARLAQRHPNVQFVVLGQVPLVSLDQSRCSNDSSEPCVHDLTSTETIDFFDGLHEPFRDMEIRLSNVIFVDPIPWFCEGHDFCDTFIGSVQLYRDGNHLSAEGSSLIGKLYSSHVVSLLTQVGLCFDDGCNAESH